MCHKHACEMNDVLLNWSKIKKFNKYERTDNSINGKDRPYTHPEIQQIIQYADEPCKTAILLLSSTGMRIGALPSVKIGDLERIDKQYKITIYHAIVKNSNNKKLFIGPTTRLERYCQKHFELIIKK